MTKNDKKYSLNLNIDQIMTLNIKNGKNGNSRSFKHLK